MLLIDSEGLIFGGKADDPHALRSYGLGLKKEEPLPEIDETEEALRDEAPPHVAMRAEDIGTSY